MDRDPEIDRILEACSTSTKVMSKTFFPERFYMPFAQAIHDPIFELIDGPYQKIAIAAPRGWGKTSIDALSLPSRHILFRLTDFIVYINKSETAAIMQTDNLRRELVTNQEIKHFFGSVHTREASSKEFDEQFSKKAWVAWDTFLLPRGAGQQVRGVLFKNDRPGLIIIDDLEDPKFIDNKDYRDGLFQWLYADVVKSVPRIGPKAKTWKIVYIDTLKHEDSVLQRLLDAPDWKSLRLEACDDNFHSTAPEFMSDEEIQREWEEHVKTGQTDVFYRELRNLPISSKDASFKKEFFRYYNQPIISNPRPEIDLKITDADIQEDANIENVIIGDPAKTAKMQSADSAIIDIGIDTRNARLYFRDLFSDKLYPDEFYKAVFDMAIKNNAKVIGIETTGLEEFIKQPIKNYMFRELNGLFFELIWLKARGGRNDEKGKIERIKGLIPYYRLGYIYHNASHVEIAKLESQLLMFPRSRLWDLMDGAAYIVEMLELGERYFSPIGSDDNLENIESEYKSLDYEEPLVGWRAV